MQVVEGFKSRWNLPQREEAIDGIQSHIPPVNNRIPIMKLTTTTGKDGTLFLFKEL